MNQNDTATGTEPCCKAGRIIRDYGLTNLDDELERRWIGRDGESASLRELQRDINRRLLRESLADAGVPPIEGDAETLRRILTSEDVSESRRREARRRLKNEGIDVNRLMTDFVSHQTVYNHLRQCRGVSPADDRSAEDRLSRAKSTIFGLQNRTELVTEQTLSRLGSDDVVTSDAFDVVVDIQAICEKCGRSHDVETLLETGECQCE